MTFLHLLDDKGSRTCRLSASRSSLFLASLLLVLSGGSVCARIAQAADLPATLKSVSTSAPVRRCDSTDWLGDLNATERQRRDLFPTTRAINLAIGDARTFNDEEFLPASGTENTAHPPSAIFKSERWRTDRAVIAASIFEAAWLTADGITTVSMRRGATEAGSAWAYGRHPTPGRTAGMMAAEFVGVEASSYLLHKMRAPKWVYIAPMVISGSLHASGAIPNFKNGE
jgi:hypothetical protein